MVTKFNLVKTCSDMKLPILRVFITFQKLTVKILF